MKLRLKLDPIVTDAPFRVVTYQPRSQWFVVRVRDDRVMTSGALTTCTSWVAVWGPMRL